MATNVKILEDESRQGYVISTDVDYVDLAWTRNPARFLEEVHFQTAKLLAEKILKDLSPAIEEAITKTFNKE